MLEWDHLRVVLAIKRGGSMQSAADQLGVDRATVLRRLDALEAQLAARLFERRSDGCVLTRAGLDIIGTVEGIADAMTALENRVSGDDRRPAGLVRVTVPDFFAYKILAPALPRLEQLHPGITIDIVTGHNFLNLARGEADIALRNRRPDHNSIVSRRVGTVAIGLFASKAYAARHGLPADGDFRNHHMLLFNDTLAGMPGYKWVEEQAKNASVAMRSNELPAIMAAARAGAGIGYFPAILAHGEPDLLPVAPGIVGKPEIFLLTHRDLRKSARVRVVFDFIVRLCTEHATEMAGRTITELFGDRPYETAFTATTPTPAGRRRVPTGSSPA